MRKSAISSRASRGGLMHHCSLPIVAALMIPAAVQAQTVAPTREEIQRQEIERDLRGTNAALSVDGDVERAPCPLADPRFADLRFTLTAAEFSGLGDVDPALLAPAWSSLTGSEIAVAGICDIRDRAATILRAQGYLAAVQVPEQTIDSGTVRFDVVLARIKSVQVRGEPGPSSAMLERYIAKLEGQPVFNTNEAERYLLLARDIPGMDVRLTLQPMPRDAGGEAGDVVAVFDVARQPIYLDVNVQNYGSKAVGRFGGLARARFNGLTGMGDETEVSIYSAEDFDEQLVLQGSHEFRVGSEGLILGAAVTQAWTQPNVPGPDVFESETFVGSLYASAPLVRSQERNVYLSGGFDFIDQSVEFSGTDLTDDNLRVLFLRGDYDYTDRDSISGRGGYTAFEPRYTAGAALEARQGIGILGASDGCGAGFANCIGPGVVPPSRIDADPTGFLIRGEAYADYRPQPNWGLRLRTRFQYSPDPLLSYEQFSGGNYTIGRGYDPGAVIGDSGIAAQLEGFFGSQIPQTPNGIAVQPFTFIDYAGVWTNNVADSYADIVSAGGGLRATIGRQAVLDVSGAVPLERAPFATSKGDVRLLMSLTVQLIPWFK